jgi:hypothetical protein
MNTTPTPALGHIVLYRSRTGEYDVPAVIAGTQASLHIPNVQAGYVPPLSSPRHVHLVCLTPGAPGKRGEAKDFRVVSKYPISENLAGTYQEWDIGEHVGDGEPEPGSWRWPPTA